MTTEERAAANREVAEWMGYRWVLLGDEFILTRPSVVKTFVRHGGIEKAPDGTAREYDGDVPDIFTDPAWRDQVEERLEERHVTRVETFKWDGTQWCGYIVTDGKVQHPNYLAATRREARANAIYAAVQAIEGGER